MVESYFDPPAQDARPNPETRAFWFSKLTFWWAYGLLSLGYRKPLEHSDLYPLPPALDVDNLESQLHIDWTAKWPVGRALVLCFTKKYGWLVGLHLSYVVINCLNPLLVLLLINAVQSGSTSISGHSIFSNAWQVVVVLTLSTVVQVTIKQQFYWLGMKAGMSLRVMSMAMIFKKALRLSLSRKSSAGSIANLISSDAEAVMEFFWVSGVFIITTPIHLILLLSMTVYIIGPVGLLGFIPLASNGPLQVYIAKKVNVLREKSREKSDERVNLLTEILQGIRLLKLYNWELPFKEILQRIRNSQLFYLFDSMQLEMWGFFGSAVLTGLSLAIVFSTYVYMGNKLTVEIAFTTLTLYQSMFEPLRQVQMFVNDTSRFIISVKYMEKFLRGEEVENKDLVQTNSTNEISIEKATMFWDPQNLSTENPNSDEKEKLLNESSAIEMTDGVTEPDKPALSDLDFHAPAGKLTCIVGPVGCGKSALLHAILGELSVQSGSLSVPSDIAYTSQTPWLITTTLQENILFGRPMDKKRYEDTLLACALGKDLALLPSGDLTEIGEKGINLSGGQKQRVSLARALYANAQCYLLDEPLSAVDMHVATWLFDRCILGMMAGRTRVLVTHQIQFLSKADLVVVMHDGKITHSGTYAALVAQGVDFESMINKKNIEEEEGKKENTKDEQPIHGEKEDTSVDPSSSSATKEIKPGIISEEERQIGKVTWEIYKQYFSASGQIWLIIVTLCLYVLTQVAYVFASFWLSVWAGDEFHYPVHVYLAIYIGLLIGTSLLYRLGLQLVLKLTYNAAVNLHSRMLSVVLAAKPSFFDMTPTGRIMNRFSHDQETLDQKLMLVVHEIMECLLAALCAVGTVCIVSPILIPPCIILGILFFFLQNYYRCTCRELKRLENISYSGILSVAAESYTGLTVIRAFKHQQKFGSIFNRKANANAQFIYNEFVVNRWLDTQLEWIAAVVVFLASASAMWMMDSLGPGLAGLAITTSLSMCGALAWGVRQLSEMEVQMNAVERILHYCATIPQESTPFPTTPSPNWPEQGTLEIKDLVVKYREDLDPVLRGVSCSIKSGEKIGVVGRTGAGKSTLTSALFRMVDPAHGSISIDGLNIAQIGLDVLRSRLAIIPQDPIIFSGSVRMNLDPFDRHPDTELWTVLEKVHLKQHVQQITGQLDFCFKDNGEGFSVGQRQLLCIGRAMLRHAKILVMDEATASLDFNTDALIKTTVRECFASKTLITIAHRLDTIMDSDRVMVFEKGELLEFDTPSFLLSNPKSRFSSLVAAAQRSFSHSVS